MSWGEGGVASGWYGPGVGVVRVLPRVVCGRDAAIRIPVIPNAPRSVCVYRKTDLYDM